MVRWILLAVFSVFWSTAMFMMCMITLVLTGSSAKMMWWVQRGWSPGLLWAAGARLKIIGGEKIDPNVPALFASNHLSALDIPVLFITLPQNVRFVAKASLRRLPVIGWFLAIARFVVIDRKNRERAAQSLKDAGERIRGGVGIIIFPEGTRSRDGMLLPFKKGAFILAAEAQVPLYPVTLIGTDRVLPPKKFVARPGEITAVVGDPIYPGPPTQDKDVLLHQTRAIMVAALQQHRGGGVHPQPGSA